MSDTHDIDFHQVNESLESANADTDAAEAHGILCGMICATGQGDLQTWTKQVMGDFDPQDLLLKDTLDILNKLYENTLAQIISGDYDLELMIRDDDEPLDERICDLGEWCQGFLFGMTLAGIKDMERLPKDAREVLQDILQISKAGYDAEEDDEESESAYIEIIEYVRVGSLVIYSELNQPENEGHKVIH